MPIYEYRCDNDHRFEVLQKFTDDPITVCEVCGAPSQRVLHPVAIHFKGSGFYATDYGRGKKPAGGGDGKAESSSGDSSANGSTSSTEKSSGGGDAKPAKPAKAAEG